MKRKLYIDNRRFIQTNPNNDIRDVKILEQNENPKYKSKEEYINEIAKVYHINTHGKFTVIVRSSFLRLHIHPTTIINPCYLYDLSSICDSEISLQSDFNYNSYLDRFRKRKKWKLIHRKSRKLLLTNKKLIEHKESSTTIVYTSSKEKQNSYKEHSSVIIHQGHSYYGFFALIFAISVIILGFILWHISIKSSSSPKSTIRPVSEDSDSNDSDDNNQNRISRLDKYKTDRSSSEINKTIDSLFDDDNDTEQLKRKYLESINSSSIGQILSDLIHNAVTVATSNSNLQPSTDLLSFLSYTPQFFHILRTIIANKCSCQSLNPTNFLQCQYLIDILHSSEFILKYLHQYHSYDKIFLVKILTHLYEILSSMNNNSYRYQYICQSLFDILHDLNKKQISSLE